MTPIEEKYDRLLAEQRFMKEMEGRQYGTEETRDAAAWFLAGWRAARSTLPDKKEMPGRMDFFDSDAEIEYRARVDGWNECRAESLK